MLQEKEDKNLEVVGDSDFFGLDNSLEESRTQMMMSMMRWKIWMIQTSLIVVVLVTVEGVEGTSAQRVVDDCF